MNHTSLTSHVISIFNELGYKFNDPTIGLVINPQIRSATNKCAGSATWPHWARDMSLNAASTSRYV